MLANETTRPKLLIMIPTEAHGGCEYNALTFAAVMAQEFDCDVAASFPMNDRLDYMASLASANGVDYVPLQCDFEGSDNPERVKEQESAAWAVLDEVQPDAVFIPLPWPKRGQGLISACHALGIPTLVKFALVPEDWSDKEFVHPQVRQAQKGRQLWFANSRYSARLLEKHYKLDRDSVDSFHVGPIGLHRLTGESIVDMDSGPEIPLSERLGIPVLNDDHLIVTTVARLSAQKGYNVLLDAADAVLRENRDVHFIWVGEGELREDLEQQIRRRNLTGNVHLVGFRSDVRAILKKSDIFAFPTVYEGGCSQALLEAMEEFVPVVVSDASAIGEIITHEKNGLMAKTGSVPDLVEKLKAAISSADLRESLAHEASQTVRDFSAEVMFDNTRSRIESLMRRRFERLEGEAALRALPQASFELQGHDAVMDFSRSRYSFGARVMGLDSGRRPTLWLARSAAFLVADPELADLDSIFFSIQAVSDAAVEGMTVTLNDHPLRMRIARDAEPGFWKVKAVLPDDLRGTLESPLRFVLQSPEDAVARDALPGSSSSARVSLVARKLVLTLRDHSAGMGTEHIDNNFAAA